MLDAAFVRWGIASRHWLVLATLDLPVSSYSRILRFADNFALDDPLDVHPRVFGKCAAFCTPYALVAHTDLR